MISVNVFSTCLCVADGVDKNNNRLQNTSMSCANGCCFHQCPSTVHKHVENTLSSMQEASLGSPREVSRKEKEREREREREREVAT